MNDFSDDFVGEIVKELENAVREYKAVDYDADDNQEVFMEKLGSPNLTFDDILVAYNSSDDELPKLAKEIYDRLPKLP